MTNEEAIGLIKPFRDCMVDQHGCPISDVVYALDLAISALSRDRWISVEERLPEPKTEVMVAYDDGEVWCLWQNWANDTEDDRLEYYTNDYAIHTVTHWMPLPSPPDHIREATKMMEPPKEDKLE